jgi:hypothetical protein
MAFCPTTLPARLFDGVPHSNCKLTEVHFSQIILRIFAFFCHIRQKISPEIKEGDFSQPGMVQRSPKREKYHVDYY